MGDTAAYTVRKQIKQKDKGIYTLLFIYVNKYYQPVRTQILFDKKKKNEHQSVIHFFFSFFF